MKQKLEATVYWTKLEQSGLTLYLAETEEGLGFIGGWNGSEEELAAWASLKHPGSPLIRADDRLAKHRDELAAYMRGELTALEFRLAARGTPFQQKVWDALLSIPYGETRTYSDIAEAIGRPAAVRAVGAAIGANPVLIAVPCHRVIGKNGALTGYRGGLAMKEALLALELGSNAKEYIL